MTNQEKVECVHEVIIRVLKDLPFTFEGLSVDLTQNPSWDKMYQMNIRFDFNSFGNKNRSIADLHKKNDSTCDFKLF